MEKDFKQINEELQYIYHTTMRITEMAKLTGDIIVHNEDDESLDNNELKFAHFHYNNIHFRLSRHIPKNATQARKMIAFSKEQSLINDHELTELCRILASKPVKPRKTHFKTVYEQIIEVWETLNDRDADFID